MINQRIEQLEDERSTMRRELRLMTSTVPSTRPSVDSLGNRNDTPLSEATPMPSVEYTMEDPDFINPEPSPEVLKRCLEREKIMRIWLPDLYYGKNLKEWKNFTTGWEAIFRAQPWTYNRHSARVNSVATGLRGVPHDRWEAAVREASPPGPVNWDAFKAFLMNMIQSPEIRSQVAFEELRGLKQKQNESVSELYTRMVALEADIGPRTEDDRVRTLDAAITNRKLKELVVTLHRGAMAPTVSSWLELAQQAEHLQKMTNPSSGGGDALKDSCQGNSGQPSDPKERRKKKEKRRLDQGLNQTPGPSMARNPASQNKDVTCYTCGQKGHYAGNRQCSKYGE